MDNHSDINMSNYETDDFKGNFEDEIRQSYLGLADNLPLPPSNSFSRIMDSINEHEEKSINSQSFFSRIFELIHDFLITPKMAWAVAGVQLAVIIFLVFSPPVSDLSTFQTLSINASPGKSVEINIVFKEDAMQKDISQLLLNTGAVIVNGPTESGLYILKVNQGHDFGIRLKAIENAKIVKFVSKRY